VNVTGSKGLKGKEIKEVMATVRAFAAPDASIAQGIAYDESMGDEIRVTVVATGLGRLRRAPQLVSNTVVRKTGTYDAPVDAVSGGQVESGVTPAYEGIRTPAVWRRESASETVRAMERNGTETYDIPAFLRRQAD
jgi:cell division protein FtsZ